MGFNFLISLSALIELLLSSLVWEMRGRLYE